MAFGLPGSRGWEKRDEHNDRGVTEEPINEDEYPTERTVDAVTGCHWRPGWSN